MLFLGRKILSYIIDYGIVFLFTQLYIFCANVFLLDPKTENQAILMLLCALITLCILTCYIPTKLEGQTVGQKIMNIRVINLDATARTYLQSFLRECLLKFTLAPILIIASILYCITTSISKKHLAYELLHDSILKTDVIDSKVESKKKSTILQNN